MHVDEVKSMDIRKIVDCLPHRYPFLLVDRVLELDPGQRVVAIKNVTINEPFFSGHFPGHPIMPGVLIVEAMAQTGGLLMMSEMENVAEKVIYFMSLDDVKWRKPVVPGDQLIFEVELVKRRRTILKMHGVAKVDGVTVAEATMMATVMDR